MIDSGHVIYTNDETGSIVRSFVNRRGARDGRRQFDHRAGQRLSDEPLVAACVLEILIGLFNGVATGHAGAPAGVLPAGSFARRGGNYPRGPVRWGGRC